MISGAALLVKLSRAPRGRRVLEGDDLRCAELLLKKGLVARCTSNVDEWRLTAAGRAALELAREVNPRGRP